MKMTNKLTVLALAGSITGGVVGCGSVDRSVDDPGVITPASIPTTQPLDVAANGLDAVFVQLPKRLYEFATRTTAKDAVYRMEDQKSADTRRAGISDLADRDYGRGAPYTQRYQQIATTDTDPTVRAAAIRALNRSRDLTATPIFIRGLSDNSPAIRLESAKALANIPDPGAAAPLLKVLQTESESADLRIAAADALKHYRTLEVARILVGQLGHRDFSVSWQARQSLQVMTGKDLRFDQGAWLAFLTGPDKPLG